jgi:hypothetical protein
MRNVLTPVIRSGICVFLILAWTSLAHACSYAKIPTPEDVFASSSAVFVGVVTSAEVLKPTNANQKNLYDDDVFTVWLKWKTEKVFKGQGIKGKSAITTTFHCGSVDITVGRRYVFAVYQHEGKEASDALKLGVIGTLQSFGTASEVDADRFEELKKVYRRLGRR